MSAAGVRAIDPGHSTGTAHAETRANSGGASRPIDRTSSAPGWPRLLGYELAAAYVGLSVELLREFVASGRLTPVRPPRPDTARAHGFRGGQSRRTVVNGTIRRALFDRVDLDEMVDRWKAEKGATAANG